MVTKMTELSSLLSEVCGAGDEWSGVSEDAGHTLLLSI